MTTQSIETAANLEVTANAYRDFAACLRNVRSLARGDDLLGLSEECERLSRLGAVLRDLPAKPELGDGDQRLLECLRVEVRRELLVTLEFLGALSNHTRTLLGAFPVAEVATYDARGLRRDRVEAVVAR